MMNIYRLVISNRMISVRKIKAVISNDNVMAKISPNLSSIEILIQESMRAERLCSY